MKSFLYLAATASLIVACGDGSSATDAASNVDGSGESDGGGIDALTANCTPAAGTDLALEVVATGLDHPVYVTSPPNDPRLFILEQEGRILVVKDGELLPTPFLDISSQVLSTGNEEGLLGLAFHPDYGQNGRFFVNYTTTPRATVIAEYTASAADPDVADRTEKVVMTFLQPQSNHNGGMVEFGPDGFLYIGVGDGGGSGDPGENGQNLTTLLGTLLRIDVDGGDPYGIPPSNPFADSANGPADPRPEIWAYGLRNPWRFSFDRNNGDLYIGDVGQGAFEEIDVQPATSTGGENYGWDDMEGTACYEPTVGCMTANRVLPVAEYSHAGGQCNSVTGGYVYRGACMPDVQGRYIYADYCRDQVWSFEYVNGEAQNHQELAVDFGANISSFGQDATGEIYVVNLQGGPGNLGVVARVVPAPLESGR